MSDVTNKTPVCHSSYMWHRKRNINVENDAIITKRARYQYYYVLESESSSSSEDRPESIHSVQDRETDYVRDTSDTDTKSDVSDYDMQVEYEVMTSEVDEEMSKECSSSGPDDMLIAAGGLVATICQKSEIDDVWMTEGEDDETDTDSYTELHIQKLKQKCRMCHIRDTFSFFPLCSHCYQIRKASFPPRPRHQKKRKKLLVPTPVTTDNLRSCLNSLSQDSGVGSSQDLQIVQVDWNKVQVPSDALLKSPNPVEIPTTSSSQNMVFNERWSTWALAVKELCIMCNEQPKNGIFLHGSSAHMCCCYNCAVKFWAKSKRCAYCNRKVSNIVKAFIV